MDPARALKDQIAQKGISLERQILCFGDAVISDDRKMSELGIVSGDTLTVSVRAKPPRGGTPFFLPRSIVWCETFWFWYQCDRWVYGWCSCGTCNSSGWISDSGVG